jgi:hypothetical protein
MPAFPAEIKAQISVSQIAITATALLKRSML